MIKQNSHVLTCAPTDHLEIKLRTNIHTAEPIFPIDLRSFTKLRAKIQGNAATASRRRRREKTKSRFKI